MSTEEEKVDDRFDLEDVEAFARDVGSQLETQALNSFVAGFFAAAMSWMDVSRYVISRLVKGNKNTGLQYTLTAVTTTLLSILVFMGVSAVSKKVVGRRRRCSRSPAKHQKRDETDYNYHSYGKHLFPIPPLDIVHDHRFGVVEHTDGCR